MMSFNDSLFAAQPDDPLLQSLWTTANLLLEA